MDTCLPTITFILSSFDHLILLPSQLFFTFSFFSCPLSLCLCFSVIISLSLSQEVVGRMNSYLSLTILLVAIHHEVNRVSSLPTSASSQDALESPDTHQDTIGGLSQLVRSSGIYGQYYDKPVPMVQGTTSSGRRLSVSRIDDDTNDDDFGESLENNHIPDSGDVLTKLKMMSTINPMGGNSLESRQIQPQLSQPFTQIIFNPLPETGTPVSSSPSAVIPVEMVESRDLRPSMISSLQVPARALATPPFEGFPSQSGSGIRTVITPESRVRSGAFVRQSMPKQLSQSSSEMHPDAPSDPSSLPVEESKHSDPLPHLVPEGTLPIASWLGPFAHRPEPAPTIGDWFSRQIFKPLLRSWGV